MVASLAAGLKSKVIAIEPQIRLAQALERTAEINAPRWGDDTVRVFHGFAGYSTATNDSILDSDSTTNLDFMKRKNVLALRLSS